MANFEGFKVGQKVHDLWYGNGLVIKKTKSNLQIKLLGTGKTWAYDQEHVTHFLRPGHKK